MQIYHNIADKEIHFKINGIIMKIQVYMTGKTVQPYLQEGLEEYTERLKHYADFKWKVLPDIKDAKNMSKEMLKQKESEQLLQMMDPNEFLVLLDERGKEYSSEAFASELEKWARAGSGKISFVIGGAYGVSEELKIKARQQISFSRMTFSHQMIRLLLAEQIYRAFTILNNQPYHHR